MGLQDKYAKLIAYAKTSNVQNLNVSESNNVLTVSGVSTAAVKDQLWTIYEGIDPEMRSGDLVLNIDAVPGGEEIYEVKSGDSLSKIAGKYPGMTWQKIFDANKDILKDPNVIHPGQKLKIPL
ncbi:MAG: LysM peptidoglycan-binding domain-containing protein [Candidatus Azobacteroides sp.]|nr:LysM peptidoglycan-binding domain-containing protein [Candidatus Azobacteroides sp.]